MGFNLGFKGLKTSQHISSRFLEEGMMDCTHNNCHYSSIVNLFIQYTVAQSSQCPTYTDFKFTRTIS